MRLTFCLIVWFYQLSGLAQINVSTIIKENDIVGFTGQKLVLIDFWATWCAPCVTANKQLEVIQERETESLFVVSISKENTEVISRFLEKHPTRLMVLKDDGQTFDTFKVPSLPYSVLTTTTGRVLWEGHPANLTSNLISRFHQMVNGTVKTSLKDIVHVNSPLDSLTIKNVASELVVKRIEAHNKLLVVNEHEIIFKGKLSNLLAVLFKVPNFQLILDPDIDGNVDFYYQGLNWEDERYLLIRRVLKKFDLTYQIEQEKMDVTEIIVWDPHLLWNRSQIDWNSDTQAHIIGDERLILDNAPLGGLAILLSGLKGKHYVYLGADDQVYDWDFHHKYDQLMKEELETGFGVLLKEKQAILEMVKINRN